MKNDTVFVIDDEADVAESIKWLLESVGLFVKVYTSPLSFLSEFNSDFSGCLLIDVRMPMMSGLELQAELNKKGNLLPVIILSGHGDVPMAVKAMKAGAIEFVTKPFNDQSLIEIVQNALKKKQEKKMPFQTPSNLEERFATLSERERDVMELVVSGMLNKNIASELNISTKTVELHRSRLMEKLEARNLAELVKLHMLYQLSRV